MPGGNRKGPMGMGPRTGRGAGYCGGAGMPGAMNGGFGGGGGGAGRGRGGRGHRHVFHATGLTGRQRAAMDMPIAVPAAVAEDPVPQSEVEVLRAQLDEVKRRLAELEAAKTRKSVQHNE